MVKQKWINHFLYSIGYPFQYLQFLIQMQINRRKNKNQIQIISYNTFLALMK